MFELAPRVEPVYLDLATPVQQGLGMYMARQKHNSDLATADVQRQRGLAELGQQKEADELKRITELQRFLPIAGASIKTPADYAKARAAAVRIYPRVHEGLPPVETFAGWAPEKQTEYIRRGWLGEKEAEPNDPKSVLGSGTGAQYRAIYNAVASEREGASPMEITTEANRLFAQEKKRQIAPRMMPGSLGASKDPETGKITLPVGDTFVDVDSETYDRLVKDSRMGMPINQQRVLHYSAETLIENQLPLVMNALDKLTPDDIGAIDSRIQDFAQGRLGLWSNPRIADYRASLTLAEETLRKMHQMESTAGAREAVKAFMPQLHTSPTDVRSVIKNVIYPYAEHTYDSTNARSFDPALLNGPRAKVQGIVDRGTTISLTPDTTPKQFVGELDKLVGAADEALPELVDAFAKASGVTKEAITGWIEARRAGVQPQQTVKNATTNLKGWSRGQILKGMEIFNQNKDANKFAAKFNVSVEEARQWLKTTPLQ